jgi:hypothetical protein
MAGQAHLTCQGTNKKETVMKTQTHGRILAIAAAVMIGMATTGGTTASAAVTWVAGSTAGRTWVA